MHAPALIRTTLFSTLGLLAVGLFSCAVVPALAASDVDPFQIETGSWMSYDRYKDNIKRGILQPGPIRGVAQPTVESAPASGNSQATDSSGAPVIATPTRPVAMPVLPGINKGFNVSIDSTADAKPIPSAQVINMDGQPTLHLKTQDWQSAAEVARHEERVKDGLETDDSDAPLHVRFSYLPNANVVPAPPPEKQKTHGRAPAQTAPEPARPAAKDMSPDLAACFAVIDAYKKKQLRAIESDRQTLAALQAAIAQLGLQKQLDFMTGAQGQMNDQPDGDKAKDNKDAKDSNTVAPELFKK